MGKKILAILHSKLGLSERTCMLSAILPAPNIPDGREHRNIYQHNIDVQGEVLPTQRGIIERKTGPSEIEILHNLKTADSIFIDLKYQN